MDLDLACHLSAITPDLAPAHLVPVLRDLREMGYRRAVLPPLDTETTDAAPLADAFAQAGMRPIAMCGQSPDADVSSPDADVRRAGIERLRRSIRWAERLGADQLNGVPYGLFGRPATPLDAALLRESARAVGTVADEAAARGVQLTFEVLNRYEESAINTAAQAMAYVDDSGSSHLGVHLDTFHMAIEEADAMAAIRRALPRLRYLELGQSGRGPLGTGAVDIAGIVRDALDAGYDGRWGVEAFSRPLAGPAADALSIWRAPYADGLELARDAVGVIRRGWSESVPGRRSHRLARAAE
ncbi:sugar phosphate isomerase/epimerase family protein [Microbacterium sp. NPDC089189]|uniref:sugar phosphate isomerase/epimerase family protein n=1 Tax=Microbacterium sp. NPDC089189 TaxID=3154972 RepID=UPI003424E6A0